MMVAKKMANMMIKKKEAKLRITVLLIELTDQQYYQIST